MTRSAPTPAPIAVATFVILLLSFPLVHARVSPLSCPQRAYGLANTQAECGSGATLYVKFPLIAIT